MEETTKLCDNCGKEIPESKYVLHIRMCSKNVKKCPQCSQIINITDEPDHIAKYHTEISCDQCHKKIHPIDLDKHKKECTNQLVPCRYCSMMVNMNDLLEHENTCGSRTEKCPFCGKYVTLRELPLMHEGGKCCDLLIFENSKKMEKYVSSNGNKLDDQDKMKEEEYAKNPFIKGEGDNVVDINKITGNNCNDNFGNKGNDICNSNKNNKLKYKLNDYLGNRGGDNANVNRDFREYRGDINNNNNYYYQGREEYYNRDRDRDRYNCHEQNCYNRNNYCNCGYGNNIERRDDRYNERRDDKYNERRDDKYNERRDDKYNERRDDRNIDRRDDRNIDRRDDKYIDRKDDKKFGGLDYRRIERKFYSKPNNNENAPEDINNDKQKQQLSNPTNKEREDNINNNINNNKNYDIEYKERNNYYQRRIEDNNRQKEKDQKQYPYPYPPENPNPNDNRQYKNINELDENYYKDRPKDYGEPKRNYENQNKNINPKEHKSNIVYTRPERKFKDYNVKRDDQDKEKDKEINREIKDNKINQEKDYSLKGREKYNLNFDYKNKDYKDYDVNSDKALNEQRAKEEYYRQKYGKKNKEYEGNQIKDNMQIPEKDANNRNERDKYKYNYNYRENNANQYNFNKNDVDKNQDNVQDRKNYYLKGCSSQSNAPSNQNEDITPTSNEKDKKDK